MKKTYRLGELFCGPGGLACGALQPQAVTELFPLLMRGQMILTTTPA